MEYVPKMKSLTSSRREIRQDWRDELGNWYSTGRPPKGLYSYKLDFGTEILRESAPTILAGSSMFEERSAFRAEVGEIGKGRQEALHRRAIEITAVDSDFFVPIMWSEDIAMWAVNGDLGAKENWRGWRHGDCDELIFIHRTEEPFDIVTDFGLLEDIDTGDFVYLPQGTTYAFRAEGEISAIAYETPERIYRPYDYWMGEQQPWPFLPDAVRAPKPAQKDELMGGRDTIHQVVVKQRLGDYTKLRYETPVFDVAGWDGEVWPFAINCEDINAIASPDFHVDPTKVTSFVTEDEGMYLQVFLPRWMQSPPYNHLNRVDEALFNHRGYEARPEITDGYLTLHPSGVPHGPDPRVVEDLAEKGDIDPEEIPWSDEIGVMVESQTPFKVLEHGQGAELEGYDESWYDAANEEELVD